MLLLAVCSQARDAVLFGAAVLSTAVAARWSLPTGQLTA
jgi:hypothetical protein